MNLKFNIILLVVLIRSTYPLRNLPQVKDFSKVDHFLLNKEEQNSGAPIPNEPATNENGYRKTRYEINAEKRKKNRTDTIKTNINSNSEQINQLGIGHVTVTDADDELRESGRGIVNVQKEGLRSVSYIIHPDNLPPPDFKPIHDLRPRDEETVPGWKTEELKVCCSENKTSLPHEEEADTPAPDIETKASISSVPYSLTFNKNGKIASEVSSKLKEIAMSMIKVPLKSKDYILHDEEPEYETLPVALPLLSDGDYEDESIPEVVTTLQNDENEPDIVINYDGFEEENVSTEDYPEVNTVNDVYITEPNLYVEDNEPLSKDKEENIFKISQAIFDSLPSLNTSENITTQTGITVSDLLDFSDSVTQGLETINLGNNTPRHEEKTSSTYHDVKNFLNDIANSPGFKNAFLGDLIKNFGSLDHNALKLIYSLLIQPLFESKENKSKTKDEETNVYQRNSAPSINSNIAPSALYRPHAYQQDLWKPMARSPKSPPMFNHPHETVEVITASPSNSFEVVLASSFNHEPDSFLRPPKRLPLFQRRVGSGEVHTPPSKVSVGLNMPPPEALAVLPKGAVLIPPSQVVQKPIIPKIPVPPTPSESASEGFSGLFSTSGLSSLPSFLSSLFQRKSDNPSKPSPQDLPPTHKRPRYTSFNYHGNQQLIHPLPRPVHPPPPVYKYVNRRVDETPQHPPYADKISKLETIYGNYKPLSYSEVTGQSSEVNNGNENEKDNRENGSDSIIEQEILNKNSFSEGERADEEKYLWSNNNNDEDQEYNEYSLIPSNSEKYASDDEGASDYQYRNSEIYLDENDYEDITKFVEDFEPMKYDPPIKESPSHIPNYYIPGETVRVDSEVPDSEPSHSENVPVIEALKSYDNEGEKVESEEFSIPAEIRNFAYLHDGFSYPYEGKEEIKTYSNPTSMSATYALSNYENNNYEQSNLPPPSDSNNPKDITTSEHEDAKYVDDREYIYYYDQVPEYEYEDIYDDRGADKISEFSKNYVEFGDGDEVPKSDAQNMKVSDSFTNLENDTFTELKGHEESPKLPTDPSKFLNDQPEIIHAPNLGPVDIPEGTIIPKEDFEKALNEQKYKHKFKRPRTETQKPEILKEEKETNEVSKSTSSPTLASEHDASIAHLWNNIKLIPLQAEEGDGISKKTKESLPSLEEEFSSFNFTEFEENTRESEKKEKKRYLMAYVLIGACVGLACLSIIGVFIIVRFRKTCGSKRIGGRSYLGKRSSLRELSHVVMDSEKSGHKLGSWFTGRNEQIGTGKLRSNMALPEVKDKLSKSNSTRDLLSISPASSQNSTPRHSQRSRSSSVEKKSFHSDEGDEAGPSTSAIRDSAGQRSSSWLHEEFSSPSEKMDEMKSKRSKSVRRTESNALPSSSSYQFYGGRPREYRSKKNAYLTSFDSEDLERATTRTSHYPTDSEMDDTNYEMSDSKEAEEILDLRRSRRRGAPSMDSAELGEELSRDLKVFQYGDESSKDKLSEIGMRPGGGGASFSRDNVQSEVFLEFENILSQRVSGSVSSSRITPGANFSRSSRPNSPDSIDDRNEGCKGDSSSRDPLSPSLPPPRPPKPNRLSPSSRTPPGKGGAGGGRARAKTPPPTPKERRRDDDDDDPTSSSSGASSTDEDRLI